MNRSNMSFPQNLKDLTFGESIDATSRLATIDKIQCGEDGAKHFLFRNGYRNLNHGICSLLRPAVEERGLTFLSGSFGTYPRSVRTVLRDLQDESEGQPDRFIRYTYPKKIDESREAVAKYLNAPTETCVFVPNATTGVNVVLRNLVYKPGDVIVYGSTIYGACHKTIDYLQETTPVTSQKVDYTYPCSDEALVRKFEETFRSIKAGGQTPRLALFDTIVSMPGVPFPFEAITLLCKAHNILSLIDGAHSIGQIPMDLSSLDPDFYVSNLHKWLHVPRGCAVFYCPVRNQALMRSSLPTSHGFVPHMGGAQSPLPPSSKSEFVNNFEFTGTLDTCPYLCVPAALEWRTKVTWSDPISKTEMRGEEAIMAYYKYLARRAGQIFSSHLSTEVMENEAETLQNCAFSNVSLPLSYTKDADGNAATAANIAQWMSKVLVEEYNTFLAILIHGEKFWVRLSAQVYLTTEDFEWGAKTLGEVCGRARAGEWKGRDEGKARLAGNNIK